MTAKQFVALGVRLFAIWLAVDILRFTPGAYAVLERWAQPASSGFVAAIIATVTVLALIAILLWLFPLAVARKLLSRQALDQAVAIPASAHIERAGFCLLGLWLLIQAVPRLVFDAVRIHLYFAPGSTLELRPEDYASVAAHVVQLVLAAWLLLGTKGLRGVLRWARTAGTNAGAADPSRQD